MPCSVTLAWRFICSIAEHPVACLPQLAIRMRSRQFRWRGEFERHKCNLLLIYSTHRHAKCMYVVLHVLRAAGNAEFYWLLCLMKLRECANMPICKYATNLTNVLHLSPSTLIVLSCLVYSMCLQGPSPRSRSHWCPGSLLLSDTITTGM